MKVTYTMRDGAVLTFTKVRRDDAGALSRSISDAMMSNKIIILDLSDHEKVVINPAHIQAVHITKDTE